MNLSSIIILSDRNT